MRRLMLLFAGGALLFPWTIVKAQTADVRMWCWSLRFHEGEGPSGLYSLEFTTVESGVNGELGLLFGEEFSHWALFKLNDEIFEDVITGILNLDTPEFSDSDGDGFDDFFDVSKGVSATSSGIYQFDFEGVTRNINATWSRGAGSAAGTCVLTLQGYGDYTHTFEVLEYTGKVSYTPAGTTVSGSVQLTNTANASETLHGPVQFVKSITDPFNLLRLQGGHLTNDFAQSLPFAANNYFRDAGWPTNYYGYFDFDDDGNINTLQPYGTWYLTIDDLNDSDGDDITNLSDTPPAAPSEAELRLRRGSSNLLLSITGDTGRNYEVQTATSLRAAVWAPVVTVTLTNSPQTVSLALPVETRFWRVQLK